ncbi:MAG: hypothetical protein RR330_06955, partial [Alistipes sp.]
VLMLRRRSCRVLVAGTGKLSGFGCRPDEKDFGKSGECDNHIVGFWMLEQASCRVLDAEKANCRVLDTDPMKKTLKNQQTV